MPTKQIVTEEQARTAWERIQKGSSVIQEAKALGFKDRIALRKAIVALVGKNAYDDAAAKLTGAGWKRKPIPVGDHE